MAARASTATLGFTATEASMIADVAISDADTMVMASAVVTNAEVAKEETSEVVTNRAATKEVTSTAAEAPMVVAVSTVEGAGKFHLLAAPCGARTREK
jgi:hypothetical protein